MTRRGPHSKAALSACRPARRRSGRTWLLTCLGLCVSIGAVQMLPLPLLPNEAWAGSREAERVREEAQQAAERAREQAQQAAERSREQARRSTEREHEQESNRPQGASNSRGDRDSEGDQRRARDDSGAEKSASQRGRDDREGKKDQDDDAPPKTVLELIKRMTGVARNGRNIHSVPPLELASAEILAVGLSPAAIARARALGFAIGRSSNFGQLHARVTRMVPPAGFDAASARDLLRGEMPGNLFGLNYVYRPYRSAAGEKEESSVRARGVRKASVGGCDMERCYGPAVIGWQPHLRPCAKNLRIGVIDTSIDLDHPAFGGRNVEIGSFLPAGVTRTINWHGTSVLAVLAGSPNSGTPGLVPDARFFAADVYHTDEGGQPMTDTLSLLRAMDWMAASKISVINMSLSGPHDELLQKAIADMSAEGILFVAAAGNDGPNAPASYPAAYEQVIAVTAIDKNLRGYIHANHGDYIDVAAPGVGIWTALPGSLEGYQSGTSFAAPHVTAIVAAVHGRARDKSKEGILRALTIRDLGPAGRDRIYGRGLARAPTSCLPEEEPSGWVTNVVRAPALPLPEASSGVTARPATSK